MATLDYEGSTEGISETQFKFIGEVLENRGIKNKKIVIEVVGSAGDNYMANVRRLCIPDVNGKLFKIIVKAAPTLLQFRSRTNMQQVFSNEHVMYTQILPKFKKIQEEVNVSKQDILRFAECYGLYPVEPNEGILLEDLTESDFVTLDRFKTLTDDLMRSVLRNFAILHSLSFVLRQKEPETFDNFKQQLYDVWSNMDSMPDTKLYFQNVEKQILDLLSDDKHRTTVFKSTSAGNLTTLVIELCKRNSSSKYNVIQHGDAWIKNVMFKFHGNKFLESVMIDYQNSRVGNPVCDLLFLILNCTDHESRLKYYNEWITYYHKELEMALSYFDLKVKEIYSKDQLDLDLKKYGKMMFGSCIMLSTVLTLKTEDAANLRESIGESSMSQLTEQLLVLNNFKSFKNRIEDLIDSCVAFDLI